MLLCRRINRFPGLYSRFARPNSAPAINFAASGALLIGGLILSPNDRKRIHCSESHQVENGPVPNQAEELMDAVRTNDLVRVSRILSSGLSARIRDSEGWTAIHWATEMGHRDLVLLLLDRDPILLNTKTNEGLSPINIAAWRGDKKLVELLLAQGAEIDDKTKWGEVPLHHAVSFEHLDVCEFLLKNGADMFAQDKLSRTPFMIVTQKGSARMKKLFEQYKPKSSE